MLSSAVLNLDYPVLGALEREMFRNVDIYFYSGLKSEMWARSNIHFFMECG